MMRCYNCGLGNVEILRCITKKPKTLGRIKAKCLIVPSRTDQCFLPGDNEEKVKYLEDGEFRCIESVYGHLAGGGYGRKEDTVYIIKEIGRFLRLSSSNF
jgi:homoserine acetyltransferase